MKPPLCACFSPNKMPIGPLCMRSIDDHLPRCLSNNPHTYIFGSDPLKVKCPQKTHRIGNICIIIVGFLGIFSSAHHQQPIILVVFQGRHILITSQQNAIVLVASQPANNKETAHTPTAPNHSCEFFCFSIT